MEPVLCQKLKSCQLLQFLKQDGRKFTHCHDFKGSPSVQYRNSVNTWWSKFGHTSFPLIICREIQGVWQFTTNPVFLKESSIFLVFNIQGIRTDRNVLFMPVFFSYKNSVNLYFSSVLDQRLKYCPNFLDIVSVHWSYLS